MKNKKYQIFVSSTYHDLVDARNIIIETILALYHFPIGMEMFSADDSEQWGIIQETINVSDYYIIIIGHRYGSIAHDGTSYTEKEYDYALKRGLPILAFIRNRDAETRPDEREYDPKKIKKLESFIKKIQANRICDFWNNIDDLATRIAIALPKFIRRKPQIGWIRDDETKTEIGNLYGINDCVLELSKLISDLPKDSSQLVRHLGLDMSTASDYVGKLICNSKAGTMDYRILIMSDSTEYVKEEVPDEVIFWSLNVQGSILRIKKHIKDYVARGVQEEQNISVEIRQYSKLPVFHGILLSGSKNISYVSICKFQRPEYTIYDWGEFSYRRIVPNKSTPSDQHLADTVDGLFEKYWTEDSLPIWKYRCCGQVLIEDKSF